MVFQEVQSSSNGILNFIIHDVLPFQIMELLNPLFLRQKAFLEFH